MPTRGVVRASKIALFEELGSGGGLDLRARTALLRAGRSELEEVEVSVLGLRVRMARAEARPGAIAGDRFELEGAGYRLRGKRVEIDLRHRRLRAAHLSGELGEPATRPPAAPRPEP